MQLNPKHNAASLEARAEEALITINNDVNPFSDPTDIPLSELQALNTVDYSSASTPNKIANYIYFNLEATPYAEALEETTTNEK